MWTNSTEITFTAREFAQLSHAAICRSLNIGSDWVDEQADEQARQEVERAQAKQPA